MEECDAREMRERAWNYFHLHASQRLTTFNFYIVIETLLASGLFLTFDGRLDYPLLRVVIGLLLITLSFVFWKLDHRNRFLIGLAEDALRHREQSLVSSNGDAAPLAIFSREASHDRGNMESRWNLWKISLTYRQCFEVVFAGFAVVGAIGLFNGVCEYLTQR